MGGEAKGTGTFIVKIYESKNSTWQGKVVWAEKQQEQHFRSALELLKLIDGAVSSMEDKESKGGYHED